MGRIHSSKSGNEYWSDLSQHVPNSLPTVFTGFITAIGGGGTATCSFSNVLSAGTSSVTARGLCWSTSPNPTTSSSKTTNGSGLGLFNSSLSSLNGSDYYIRAYATNSSGTAYGSQRTFQSEICLANGTKVRLANGRTKNIEDVQYNDNLLVWNFDDRRFDTARPLWIKKQQTTNRFNLLTFSDGSTLKTINQHRIFSKEQGAFVYPMVNETPIGTTTVNEDGNEITLVNRKVVFESVDYSNVITERHINLFAGSILTSCRYNNIYPIRNMEFVKDDRVLRTASEFHSIPEEYYEGLRLAEQTIPLEHIEWYVGRLENCGVKRSAVMV